MRLALFAEMVKGKPWTPATLREVGGTEGVGVTFLEETFSRRHRPARASPPPEGRPGGAQSPAARSRHRHQGPDAVAAGAAGGSGYADRPRDFDDLIRILDGELRLITPDRPRRLSGPSDSPRQPPVDSAYQLTHDYLVPSLRDWLTRKQRETRRGRAELRLAERAALWSTRPENRYLPSLWEFCNIQLLANRRTRTEPQQKMMAQAGRVYSMRLGLAAVVLAALTLAGREISSRFQAAALVEQLVGADVAQVPRIVDRLAGYRRWANPLLRKEYDKSRPDSTARLHAALALLSVDPAQAEYLRQQLLVVPPPQFAVVRDALQPPSQELVAGLWKAALDPQRPAPVRFQAACASASYVPADPRWSRVRALVAGHLVALQASDFLAWREALRPARKQLIEPLSTIYGDERRAKPHLCRRGPWPIMRAIAPTCCSICWPRPSCISFP